MSLQRKTVLDALFALVTTSANYATVGRRLVLAPDQVAQPALFQRFTDEHHMPLEAYGIPQTVILNVELWIYVKNGGPADPPENVIDPLLDSLDTALATNTTFPDGRQTLGLDGYVIHAWREGETIVSQGELADQSIIVAPVRVEVRAQLGSP